jgi:RsiW-degrading membrane proteinase PrsW (M82 family)
LIWLLWFWFQDWYDREPLKNVAITFGLGALATIAAMVFNTVGILVLQTLFGQNLFSEAITLFCVVGPIEEAVKMAAVLVYAYRKPQFNEPVDGVVYSASAALGFAAAENVMYMARFGSDIFMVRGILSNPGHALFAAFWGLALSRAKAQSNVGGLRTRTIVGGWLAAAMLHALFDLILSSGQYNVLPGAAVAAIMIALMLAAFVYVEYMTLRHVSRSPHRKDTMLLSAAVFCSACGQIGISGQDCPSCGAYIAHEQEPRFCPKCNKEQRAGLATCLNCGASLLSQRSRPLQMTTPHLARINDQGNEEVVFVLDKQEVSVGKTLDNAFVIDDPTVSKHHAKLVWHPTGNFVIVDLNSTNGTYVNGRRVGENLLKDGFEIRFGRVQYVYRAVERPPVFSQLLPQQPPRDQLQES